ncbi:hypothetical protein MMPV_007813 [Pyropia vietnamensis]
MAPPTGPTVLKGVTVTDFAKPSQSLAAQCRDVAKQLYEQQSAVAVGLLPDAPLPEVTVAATGSCGRAGGVPIGALCKLPVGPDVDDQMLWRTLELRCGPLGRWLRNELLVAEKLTQRAAAQRSERAAKRDVGGARGVTWAPSAAVGKEVIASDGRGDGVGDDSDSSDSDGAVGDGSGGNSSDSGSDSSGRDSNGSDGSGRIGDGSGGNTHDSGSDSSGRDSNGSDGSGRIGDGSGSDGSGRVGDGIGSDGSGSVGSDSDGSGSSSDVDSDTARARRRAVAFESASDSDGDAAAVAAARTPLARAREARAAKLAAVEAASVAAKPWQLRGEVGSRDRPADSLLGADLEHDVARRPTAPPSTVTTAAIEALLRRRIADAHWDDVAMPVRPTEAVGAAVGGGGAPDGLAEVSQQKPTQGLGDLYAAEYVAGRERLAAGAAADGGGTGGGSDVAIAPPPVTESPEQAEVNAQWRALSRKLDLLANLRLPPKEVARTDGDGGRPDTAAVGIPALAAEDVVPEGISDATLLAPQEVYEPATTAPAGERERTKEERAAARRRKKRRSRGAGGSGGGGGNSHQTVVFGADLMGGSPGGRKRGRADGGRRSANGDGDGGSGHGGAGKPKKVRATSSAAFFRDMQETVAADIQRKKDKAEGRGVSKATMGSAAKFMR